MTLRQLFKFSAAVVALSFAVSAGAADSKVEQKQAEIQKAVQATLQDFYKANPKLKDEVQKAGGYAAFNTYGGSLLIGGAGGEGLAHDNKTGKNTYMSIAQASAGIQVGISETRFLFLFKDSAALKHFIDSGWEAGATASAGAGAGDKSATAGAGAGDFTGGKVYTLTKTGVQAGGAVAGTKVWKNADLN